jgi:hypothetical protein
MYTPLLFSLLSASLFYLGSRALITRRLWSLYPPRLAAFMDCSACTGFWWGLVIAVTVGRSYDLAYIGLSGLSWLTPVVVGLCSIVLTPIAAGLMQAGLDKLGTIAPEEDA